MHTSPSGESSVSVVSPSQTVATFDEPALRQTSFLGIISQCSRMQRIFSVVEKVARTDSTILVLGETGTGKELIARAAHKLSKRTGNLVPVNCGAIPEEILESELFGHEKGAFTGAVSSRIGRFQMADEGTIFLDEIGEMSPKLQVKLLRVLQERVVEPVGSTKSIPVNVRVIAATNKDLAEEVRAGRFREDLYYRLNVIPVKLPPLRDRGEDVGILAQFFLNRISEQLGGEVLTLSPDARSQMMSYSWPGNVRELENLIERLAVLAEGDKLSAADLPDYIHVSQDETQIFETLDEIPPDGVDFNQLVDQFENRLIRVALSRTGGNKKAAAKLLRLNRTTLVEKIKKKGLESRIEMTVTSDEDPLFSAD